MVGFLHPHIEFWCMLRYLHIKEGSTALLPIRQKAHVVLKVLTRSLFPKETPTSVAIEPALTHSNASMLSSESLKACTAIDGGARKNPVGSRHSVERQEIQVGSCLHYCDSWYVDLT